ncbi:MAG TPA: C_GCAxxG_C_C family protein [Dehalococcoidia bacterium]|jgi:C_GCAxxG_C_C family probable redox protein|nr:C_GCAxxG_C_C family protein [Dehalococcoidia bacterium]
MTEAAEKAYELGKHYEKTYRGCSQCVIAALQDTFDIRDDAIFKAATGLAGGGSMATDGSCGAYVGAIMVLGYLLGRERDNFSDPEGIRFRTHELARKFHERYIDQYGSVVCRDIQTKVMGRPYYLCDPEEYQKFHNAGAHDVHCPEVVGKAARWMAEIIEAENLAPRS